MGIKARERLLNVLIFIGALGLLFVVGYPQYKDSLPSRVRIGVDNTYGSLPFYVAQRDTSRRYFVIEKVEPEFIEITGNALQGLKDGLYDVVAVPWYDLLVSPSVNGDTVRAFGGIEIKSGRNMDALILPVETKIKRLADIKGKRLGYLQSDEYLVNLILQQLEAQKLTDVKKVLLRPDEIATAFKDGKVDVIYCADPYRAYMVYLGNSVFMEGLISSYIVSSMPYMAIVMREQFVKVENRVGAIRVKDAIEASLSYLNRNPDIAKRTILKNLGWEPDPVLISAVKVPEFQRLAEINLKYVENYQTELVKRGIGTCGIKPNEFLFERVDFVR
ncbi:ABC transporter substrate-binding protein [candidate division WOR-3 bacterium]|nr:ABC transporter substrate-binding protein [candidate division WOR-3 bacterium]